MDLVESIVTGFVIIGVAFIISYLKGKMETSIFWYMVSTGLLLGLIIYFME